MKHLILTIAYVLSALLHASGFQLCLHDCHNVGIEQVAHAANDHHQDEDDHHADHEHVSNGHSEGDSHSDQDRQAHTDLLSAHIPSERSEVSVNLTESELERTVLEDQSASTILTYLTGSQPTLGSADSARSASTVDQYLQTIRLIC